MIQQVSFNIKSEVFATCESLKSNSLKGLGHAILGNFSTYQMDIELTKIWK